jgi:hypothetical protein
VWVRTPPRARSEQGEAVTIITCNDVEPALDEDAGNTVGASILGEAKLAT